MKRNAPPDRFAAEEGPTMGENRKRNRINWGSLIGWLIFILIIAGGPLARLIGRAVGGSVSLPANWLPILIGTLVVLSIVVSAVRALGTTVRSRGDVRLPTDASAPPRAPSAPMPPFGGPAGLPQQPPAPPATPRSFTLPPDRAAPRLPPAPRFEPVINPRILLLGILGLILLGGAALVVLVGSLP